MRSKLIIILFFLCATVQTPLQSFAWGAQGHRLIVEMALSLLSPGAKLKLMAALGGYPADDGAVWMDSVRHVVPKYDYMNNWHFLNMEKAQTYDQVASDSDVVFNLQRVIDAMDAHQAISADSLLMNLKILFHLMGDITQPLHCGYGSDRGANSISVHTTKFNVPKNNLHHVWDVIIIDEGKIDLSTCLTYYHSLSASQLSIINAGDTKSWMLQSRTYLTNVYNFKRAKTGVSNLTIKYLNANVPIVQQQLVYAAVRLANALEKYFGS